MSLITLALVVFLFFLTPVEAGQLQKQYFTATQPGAWVTVETMYDNGGRTVYTYSRLDDDQGRAVVEFSMEVSAGPGAGTSSRQLFVTEEGFDITANALGYMKSLQIMITQVGEQISVMPPTLTETIRETAADYSDAFSFEGTEKVGGFDCDRYAYRVETGGPHRMVNEGSMWLSRQVPFGVVKQTGTVTDADGAPLSSYEQTYVDSGTGADGTEQLVAMIGDASPLEAASPHAQSDAPPRRLAHSFPDAYDTGAIRLLVAVDAASKGQHLEVSIVNTTNESIRVSTSAEEVRLAADSPINTLTIAAFEAHEFDLEPGEASPSVSFKQLGERGVVEGEFSLIVYEGTPLYTGSVTIGSL